MLKILKTGEMPDDTDIQLEMWVRESATEYSVAAYPVAAASSEYGWIKRGEHFRLAISARYKAEAEMIYKLLETGSKTLSDFQKKFWSNKDKYYLGLEEKENVGN